VPHSVVYGFIISVRAHTILVACSSFSGCNRFAPIGPWEYALPQCAAVLYVYARELICIKVPHSVTR
jgi:hypothetical protein